jgi:hypothetical protein
VLCTVHDRERLLQHRGLAEKHVSEGAKRVARQRDILAELHRDDHDTTTAQALLEDAADQWRTLALQIELLEQEQSAQER